MYKNACSWKKAPPPGRYTPRAPLSYYSPRYSVPRSLREPPAETRHIHETAGLGPSSYNPRDAVLRPTPRSATFQSSKKNDKHGPTHVAG